MLTFAFSEREIFWEKAMVLSSIESGIVQRIYNKQVGKFSYYTYKLLISTKKTIENLLEIIMVLKYV